MNELVVISIATVIASAVGTLSGFGVGTILIPILSFLLPPLEAIFLAAIIHWFHDIFKIGFFYRGTNWPLWRYFGLPAVVTSLLGALLISHESFAIMPIILGLFFIAYGIFVIINPLFSIRATPAAAVLGGSIAGFCAGLFGVRGAITSSFLTAFSVNKQTYLATIGLISLLIDSARISVYWLSGITLDNTLYHGLLLFVPASFAGSLMVQPLMTRMSQEQYRMVVAWFIVLAGIKLVFFPTTGA